MKTIRLHTILGLLALFISISANAGSFWVSGLITRTISDGVNFGGCMIRLSQNLGNGCPENGWVSLDCNGGYIQGAGERAYSTALLAASLNKQVSVFVNNAYKYNGYCVATRLDMNNE